MCRSLRWAYTYFNPVQQRKYTVMLFKKGADDDYQLMSNNIRKIAAHRGIHNAVPTIIRCGRCVDCRLHDSKVWATRCMLEAKYHQHNYFLTLTYDPEHLPVKDAIDLDTGEVFPQLTGTLKKEDLQDFWKNLRSYYKYHNLPLDNFKYKSCGEYGDKYDRPHYHAICFGLYVPDLKFSHKSKKGFPVYTSEIISKIWKKGKIALGDVTFDSCAYVARYVLKKIYGKYADEYYKIIGKDPEFTTNSLGIAKDYYLDHRDTIYETDELFINTDKGVQVVKPPRYFDKMYDIDYPEDMKRLKDARQKLNEMRQKLKFMLTDKDPEEVMNDIFETKDIKYKSLKRHYEKDGSI